MRTRIALMAVFVLAGWAFFWFVVEHRTVGTAKAAFASGDSAGVATLAGRGDREAEYDMGIMCEEGQAVPKDYAAAADWFRKAAEQGHVQAERRLGLCYAEGRGIERDGRQAAYWLEKAAVRGDVPAQAGLGRLYAREKEWKAALKWYREAAERGDGASQFELSKLYHSGKAGVQDDVLSQMYLVLAAAHGCKSAVQFRMEQPAGYGITREQAQKAMTMAQAWKPVSGPVKSR